MPARPDLRHLSSGVRDAFADCDRDTLLEILTFVVKEYVVDGPPPMLVHQVEELADLRGLSFAQLVTTLQQRLEQPELSLFAVDGETVSVRVGGAMHPLAAGRTPLAAASPPGAASATVPTPAAELPRPAAGVRVVEAGVVQAPRPTAGLSVRSAASPASSSDAPAPSAAPSPAASPAAPSSASSSAPPGDKPADKPASTGGDDAAARFSLLELD